MAGQGMMLLIGFIMMVIGLYKTATSHEYSPLPWILLTMFGVTIWNCI